MADLPALIQTDDKAFIRDTRNHALLNTDWAALERHRAARQKAASRERELHSLHQQLDTVQAELADLKALLLSRL